MCEGLVTLHTCTALCYNVNCVISKKTTGKCEGIPPLLTLIVFLSSFMIFETGICECFIIFGMTLVFIYTMSSFRCMRGTRTKGGFPHCLHLLALSCLHSLMSMKDTG
jgi:hypothetical protein